MTTNHTTHLTAAVALIPAVAVPSMAALGILPASIATPEVIGASLLCAAFALTAMILNWPPRRRATHREAESRAAARE